MRAVTGLGDGLPLLPADVVDRPGLGRRRRRRDGRAHRGRPAAATPRRPPARSPRATAGLQLGGVLALPRRAGARPVRPVRRRRRRRAGCCWSRPNVVRRPAGARRAGATTSGCGCACTRPPTGCSSPRCPGCATYFAAGGRPVPRRSADGTRGRHASSGCRRDACRDPRRRAATRWRSSSCCRAPSSAPVLDRLLALTTLLEGHADHVMDAVGPGGRARRWRRSGPGSPLRRRGGGLRRPAAARAARASRRRSRQYAVGLGVHQARRAARPGWTGSTGSGSSPETLPTRAELADPGGLAAPASASTDRISPVTGPMCSGDGA